MLGAEPPPFLLPAGEGGGRRPPDEGSVSSEEDRRACHPRGKIAQKMTNPGDLVSRARRAAKAAEQAGLTAAADDLYRLAFDVEEVAGRNGCPGRVLFEIAEIGTPRRFASGERLYAAFGPAADFFLIIEGRVAIERITPFGPQALGGLGPGDFVGAAEALLNVSRLGQASAGEPTLAFSIPTAELFGGAPSPELGDYVLRRLARYLRALNDEFGKFFPSAAPPSDIGAPSAPQPATISSEERADALERSGLAPADADLLTWVGREESYPQGAVIFREGDRGDTLSVIARGRVRISRRIAGAGEEAFAILEPGAIFGEMAVFEPDAPLRSADVIAHDDCALLTIDRAALDRLRETVPAKAAALTAVLCRIAARRIAETSERLVRWRMMAGMF